MASAAAITPPFCFLGGNKTHFKNPREIHFSLVKGKHRCIKVTLKAVDGDSDSSSESVIGYVRNISGNSEDRIALAGLGFAGIVAIWASSNLITAIDKLPVVPSTLEFIGILVSWWFINRYLLFKPDREELVKIIRNSISDVIGQ